MWLIELFFLNSANLIYRGTDISKYFRESLEIRDNESRLYLKISITEPGHSTSYKIVGRSAKTNKQTKKQQKNKQKKQKNKQKKQTTTTKKQTNKKQTNKKQNNNNNNKKRTKKLWYKWMPWK